MSLHRFYGQYRSSSSIFFESQKQSRELIGKYLFRIELKHRGNKADIHAHDMFMTTQRVWKTNHSTISRSSEYAHCRACDCPTRSPSHVHISRSCSQSWSLRKTKKKRSFIGRAKAFADFNEEEEEEEEEEDEDDDQFQGSILQDVRKGQDGFATAMRIKKKRSNGAATDDDERFPKIGDVVEITFSLRTSEGQVLQQEEEANPVTFEVGAADVVGNPLFKAFDKAVRSMRVGESVGIEASGGEYDANLLFRVPTEHPEIARLKEVWAEKGGLQEGGTVTLMNGNPAVVRSMDDEMVTLDANHPFAGSDILFDLTLREIKNESE